MKKTFFVLLALILIFGTIYFLRKPFSEKLDPDSVKVKEFCQVFYALENAYQNEFGNYSGSIDSVFKEQSYQPPQKIGSYDFKLLSDGKEYHLIFYSEKNDTLFFNSFGKLQNQTKVFLDLAPKHPNNSLPEQNRSVVVVTPKAIPAPAAVVKIQLPALLIQEDTLGVVQLGTSNFRLIKKMGYVDKKSPYYHSGDGCFDTSDIGFQLIDEKGNEAYKYSENIEITSACGLDGGISLDFFQLKDSVYHGLIFTEDSWPSAPGEISMNILKLSGDTVKSISNGLQLVSEGTFDHSPHSIPVISLQNHLLKIYWNLQFFNVSLPFFLNLDPNKTDTLDLTFSPSGFDRKRSSYTFEIRATKHDDSDFNETTDLYGIDKKGKTINLKKPKFEDVEAQSATISFSKPIPRNINDVIEFIYTNEKQILIKILVKGKEYWIHEEDGNKIYLWASG